jgi:hypothetical protein
MKKYILSIYVLLAPLVLYAGTQDKRTIHDQLMFHNNSARTVTINGNAVPTGSSYAICTSTLKGQCTMRAGKYSYVITFPTYNPRSVASKHFDIAHLDVTTLEWLGGNADKIHAQGLDAVAITNDTCYPIAVMFALNALHNKAVSTDTQKKSPTATERPTAYDSSSHFAAALYTCNTLHNKAITVDPQETISRVVGNSDGQKTGILEIVNHLKKKNIFMLPRRIYPKHNAKQTDWREVTLKVSTIALFHNGFAIRAR